MDNLIYCSSLFIVFKENDICVKYFLCQFVLDQSPLKTNLKTSKKNNSSIFLKCYIFKRVSRARAYACVSFLDSSIQIFA